MQNPLPPWIPMLTPVRFEGKKKRPMEPDSERLERKLLDAGVDGRTLWEKFRVRLWSIRQLKGQALLKVDTSAADKKAGRQLAAFFEDKLAQPVTIKEKKLQDCCGSYCKGCLAVRAEKQETWQLNRRG